MMSDTLYHRLCIVDQLPLVLSEHLHAAVVKACVKTSGAFKVLSNWGTLPWRVPKHADQAADRLIVRLWEPVAAHKHLQEEQTSCVTIEKEGVH